MTLNKKRKQQLGANPPSSAILCFHYTGVDQYSSNGYECHRKVNKSLVGTTMSCVHVVTVGTSLATNHEKYSTSKKPHAGQIERVNKNRESQFIKELVAFILQQEERSQLCETCAELNAIKDFVAETSLVYLVHTDTNVGRCCAEAIRQFLILKKLKVKLVEIQDLHDSGTLEKGLANFTRQIAYILRRHKDVKICATGGLKPEIAIATILGFIAKTPIYFVHPSFGKVYLPPIPVKCELDRNQLRKTNQEEGRTQTVSISQALFMAIAMLLGKKPKRVF